MFDTTLGVLDIEIVGEESYVTFGVVTGVHLPLANGQALPVPTGVYRVPMSREMAIKRGQELIAVAEAIPEPEPPKDKSDLILVGSMAGVDNMAKTQEAIRKGS